jgi:glycosyltransferase involved in cell wall biosynthesis
MRTKNREVLLRRALESVKWQTYSLWQLVVVNDGGDPVLVDELVQHVFGDDCRVSVINHPISVGMEAASNAGLSHLRTELAIIHDDDDSWAPDMLKVLTAVLRERNALFPSVRGVVSRVNWVQETVAGNHIEIESIQPWNDGSRDRLTEGLIKLHRLAMQNLFPPIAFLFDLSLARELGCFDQELPVQGDWDFHLRFAGAADIWVHPELLAFYHHRRNATGDMENTVVSGKAKHDLYNTFLRNRYLRDANSPMAAAMATLREYGLEIQLVHDKQAHIHWDLNNSQNGPRAKEKSKLAKALSRLNRQRKRLKIKEFFRGLS